MLEFLLRTNAVSIATHQCDDLITKICALAKVHGNQQKRHTVIKTIVIYIGMFCVGFYLISHGNVAPSLYSNVS